MKIFRGQCLARRGFRPAANGDDGDLQRPVSLRGEAGFKLLTAGLASVFLDAVLFFAGSFFVMVFLATPFAMGILAATAFFFSAVFFAVLFFL
jgi:hypothetical protein